MLKSLGRSIFTFFARPAPTSVALMVGQVPGSAANDDQSQLLRRAMQAASAAEEAGIEVTLEPAAAPIAVADGSPKTDLTETAGADAFGADDPLSAPNDSASAEPVETSISHDDEIAEQDAPGDEDVLSPLAFEVSETDAVDETPVEPAELGELEVEAMTLAPLETLAQSDDPDDAELEPASEVAVEAEGALDANVEADSEPEIELEAEIDPEVELEPDVEPDVEIAAVTPPAVTPAAVEAAETVDSFGDVLVEERGQDDCEPELASAIAEKELAEAKPRKKRAPAKRKASKSPKKAKPAALPVATEPVPQDDVWVSDAVAWSLSGEWLDGAWSPPQGEECPRRLEELREAAAKGRLTIWGRSNDAGTWQPIDAAYWKSGSVEAASLTQGRENVVAEPKASKSRGKAKAAQKYSALKVSRAQVEELWRSDALH